MNGKVLWRGEWAPIEDLERHILDLPGALSRDLGRSLDMEALLNAAETVSQRLLAGDVPDLTEALTEHGSDEKSARATVAGLAHYFSREALKTKLTRELGTCSPSSVQPFLAVDSVHEAWAPLGVLVHIAAGNVPQVTPQTALEGLLTGNINLVKMSGSDGPFGMMLLKELVDADSTGQLAPFVYAFPLSSKRGDLLRALLSQADGIVAWGGEDALTSIREMAPKTARLVEWGHKLSFAYVTPSGALDPAKLTGLAQDICENEQLACSSPQCVFLDTESADELTAFAHRLAAALRSVSDATPRVEPGTHERAEVTAVTEVAIAEEALGLTRVLQAEDQSFRILVDYGRGLSPSPLYRTVWLKALPRKEILEVLRPMRAYLQTVGLACAQSEAKPLGLRLLTAGASRIRRPGKMTRSYSGGAHDGVYALPRYARRVNLWMDL